MQPSSRYKRRGSSYKILVPRYRTAQRYSQKTMTYLLQNVKRVKYPHYRPTWPRGVQEVKAPRFLDTRHMKVVRSSPLRTGRLYPPEYPGTHFQRLSRPQAHGVVRYFGKNPRGSIPGPSDQQHSALTTTPPQALLLQNVITSNFMTKKSQSFVT